MSKRGRPIIHGEEKEWRSAMCQSWAAEIKNISGLSAKDLARELNYGSGSEDADGRAWRLLAAGRAPSPANLERMTRIAAGKGWLLPFGYLRYSKYWQPSARDDELCPGTDLESWYRSVTFRNLIIMLLSHARKCGVDQEQFFTEATQELAQMKSSVSELPNEEIERRARRIAQATVKGLLEGPQYPETSLREDEPPAHRHSSAAE